MPRVLVVHPEAEVRTSIEESLRNVGPKPLIVESAPSLADGLRQARAIKPHVVFLDLGAERSLVLDTARELRAPGCLIVGLYNPLVLRGDLPFFRDATRAGVGDFIPLPASDSELLSALNSAETRDGRAPAEGRVIAFFSQQGGVGTTSLAVNTALLMAGSDQVKGKVALCDAAVQFGSAVSFLGLKAQRDLADLVRDPQGVAALPACLTEEPGSGLKVLAAPRDPVEGDKITPEDITRVLIELRRRFDWVVVDTPPTLDLLTLAVLDSADKIFVVTEAVTPTILGTSRLLKVLNDERLGADRIRLVLNRFNTFEGNLSERTVADQLGRPVDHVVPYDRSFVTAATRGRPVLLGRPSTALEAAFSALGQDATTLQVRGDGPR
ncbi:MAG: AAA family ATPase [Vicinamibacteria bacterium]|nr:AAA family ATPase [Vicinamibacteria bacterium]MBP9945536.1 AAA family ATPase [Vicinamibacteria bacterium]